MQKLLFILLISSIGCTDLSKRKPEKHRICQSHGDFSYTYHITSEIVYKDGCASFTAYENGENYESIYTVCGSFVQNK